MAELPKIVRQGLERQARHAGAHPDANLLTAFAEQSLSRDERARVLAHLAVCPACRETVNLLVSSEEPATAPQSATQPHVGRLLGWRWASIGISVALVAVTFVLWTRSQRYDLRETRTYVSAPQPQPASKQYDKLAALNKEQVAKDQLKSGTPAAQLSAEKSEPKLLAKNTPAANTAAPSSSSSFTFRDEPKARRLGPAMPGLTPYAANQQIAQNQHMGINQVAPSETMAKAQRADAAVGGVAGNEVANMNVADAAPNPAAPAAPPPAPAIASSDVAGKKLVDVERAAPPPTDEALQVNAATAAQSQSAPAPATSTREIKKAKRETASFGAATAGAKTALVRLNSERWTISSAGVLQRSLDNGTNWEPVLTSEGVTFHVVATAGPQVWAGGSSGALFHSTDAGQQWTRVHPDVNDRQLTADVVSIDLSKSGDQVRVHDKDGAVWSSTDFGQHWTVK